MSVFDTVNHKLMTYHNDTVGGMEICYLRWETFSVYDFENTGQLQIPHPLAPPTYDIKTLFLENIM